MIYVACVKWGLAKVNVNVLISGGADIDTLGELGSISLHEAISHIIQSKFIFPFFD